MSPLWGQQALSCDHSPKILPYVHRVLADTWSQGCHSITVHGDTRAAMQTANMPEPSTQVGKSLHSQTSFPAPGRTQQYFSLSSLQFVPQDQCPEEKALLHQNKAEHYIQHCHPHPNPTKLVHIPALVGVPPAAPALFPCCTPLGSSPHLFPFSQ